MKIREQEFCLISLAEREIMENTKLNELLKLDNFFTMLDAFLSLLYSVQQFDLVPVQFAQSSETTSQEPTIKISKACNLLLKFQKQQAGEPYFE